MLCVLKYDSEDEAVAIANDSIFGLGGGVWSEDLDHAREIAARMRTGTVWINDWHLLSERMPFGGYKQSGIGREFGEEGLNEYTEVRLSMSTTPGRATTSPGTTCWFRAKRRRPIVINAAIVGLGRWGQTLVDSLGEGSDAIRFARAVTRTPAKVEDYAAANGMALGSDYDAVLSDPGIDAVVLATPHSLHRSQIVTAAEAGKHVFCEKPLTLSATDAEAAIGAVDEAG